MHGDVGQSLQRALALTLPRAHFPATPQPPPFPRVFHTMRFAVKLKTPDTRHIGAPVHLLDPGQAADLSACYTPIMDALFLTRPSMANRPSKS